MAQRAEQPALALLERVRREIAAQLLQNTRQLQPKLREVAQHKALTVHEVPATHIVHQLRQVAPVLREKQRVQRLLFSVAAQKFLDAVEHDKLEQRSHLLIGKTKFKPLILKPHKKRLTGPRRPLLLPKRQFVNKNGKRRTEN